MKRFCHRYSIVILGIISLFSSEPVFCQKNCDFFYEKDSPEHCACMLLYGDKFEDADYYQGSQKSQALCDSAIVLYPTFADAYYIKSIPFLKRGEFEIWKTINDKAVAHDTLAYLGYRGGVQFMFLRNYEAAIKDIETLQAIADWDDLGTIYNGEYDLEIIRALAYKGLGDSIKALDILENHLNKTNDAGLWGYYHLGVMYYQQNRYNDAMQAFLNQISSNEIADAHFYIGLIHEKRRNHTAFQESIKRAHGLYVSGRKLRGNDSFMDYPDKIYLKQIEDYLSLHKEN